MKTITFFNNKGGVGKTTLVYHIAWMLSELGIRTLAIDLDPQSNLSSMFLDVERLEEIYEKELPETVINSINPVVSGDPYIPVYIEKVNEDLGLIIGNISLSVLEDKLSNEWLRCLNGDVYSFKVTSIFYTIINDAAKRFNAKVVLIDVGPNLGAINRSVTISSDYIIMPVASDLFSLQGIKNIGLTLGNWKREWEDRLSRRPKNVSIEIPENTVKAAGYIVMQSSAFETRPVKSYLKWANRIPSVYSKNVLNSDEAGISVDKDNNCIGLLKHYRSLAPMSMEVHKPMFLLKPADGAIGAHLYAVQQCYKDFEKLTKNIMDTCK